MGTGTGVEHLLKDNHQDNSLKMLVVYCPSYVHNRTTPGVTL